MRFLLCISLILVSTPAIAETPTPTISPPPTTTPTPTFTPTPTPTPTALAWISAVVSYTITGDMCNGTETIYLKGDNKRRIERDLTSELMGQHSVENSIIIKDGVNVYYITPESSSGTRQLQRTYSDDSERMSALYGEAGGQEEVLGRQCTIYQLLNQKSWLWQDIPLKVETGIAVKTATNLEVDVPVDDALFEVPPDITINTFREQ